MGDGTSISWTDATWNPTRGCRRVSPGCQNCYAERQANRFAGPGRAYEALVKMTEGGPRWTGATKFVTEHLADPLSWKKPRRIFVDSMSDLFYEGFTNEQIAAVFGVMAACPQHTFQVLTKRSKRMREWFDWLGTVAVGSRLALSLDAVASLDDRTDARFANEEWQSALANVVNGWSSWRHQVDDGNPLDGSKPRWPLPNVWLGVSVENQDAADARIPDLLGTPAAIRFLSCEPLLGEVEIARWMKVHARWLSKDTQPDGRHPAYPLVTWHRQALVAAGWRCPLHWVIAGCESGPGARPCDVTWLRSLRDQCAAASVPFFLKQAEESADLGDDRLLDIGDDDSIAFDDGSKLKARRPGGNHIVELPYLDGVQHAAFPEVA